MVRRILLPHTLEGGIGGVSQLCQASAKRPQMVVYYKLQYKAKMHQNIQLQL